MTEALKNKVALVIGAARNVGRAYALGLAGAGAKVVAVDRLVTPASEGAPSLEEVVATGRAAGGDIVGYAADLARTEDIEQVVRQTLVNFGRIDVLLYNAMATAYADPLAVPDADWDVSLSINVRAPYTCIRLVAPHMIAQKSGSIILMSSRASLAIPADDPAHAGLLAYGVAKAALNRIATYFAEELKPHNIAVNVLSPGQVKKLAGGAPPTPEQFAPPILYLARQTAQTFTGQWRNTTDFGVSWP